MTREQLKAKVRYHLAAARHLLAEHNENPERWKNRLEQLEALEAALVETQAEIRELFAAENVEDLWRNDE